MARLPSTVRRLGLVSLLTDASSEMIYPLLPSFLTGVDPVDPNDEQLVARIDALRQVLEVVYGTPVTLAGEERDPATPIIRGRVDADEVAGYVAAVRADRATGVIEGHTTVRRVEQSGTVIGVEIRRDPSGPRS